MDGPKGEPQRTYLVNVLGARTPLRVSGARDHRIATIAQAQRGRVSRRQLHAAGITSGVISRLLAGGMIIELHRGVYAVGHLAPIELGDETAALLAVRDGAVLSHFSAAALWGLLPADSGDGPIHILVSGSMPMCPAGVRIHRTRTLAPADVRIHRGLPVTSPARALLDLSGRVSERQLELAFDRGLVARILRVQDVSEVLGRAGGRSGLDPLRALVDRQRDPELTRSEAEERFLALVRGAQLPEPKVNARIHGYEVDFLWPGRLVVEIDGYRFHSTRSAFEHDHRKDRVLRSAGLPVMRFTWSQLTHEPFAVVVEVAQGLVGARGL